MGTNFYWKDPEKILNVLGMAVEVKNKYNPLVHIGKRSAAGLYCFGCGVTLIYNDVIKGFDRSSGNSRNKLVHTGQAGQGNYCPQCFGEPQLETLDSSAAGLELGFRKGPSTPEERQGVRTCSSFSWAQDPGWVLSKLLALVEKEWKDEGYIAVVDEYGDEYTARKFLENILVACPMWFTDSVGKEFS